MHIQYSKAIRTKSKFPHEIFRGNEIGKKKSSWCHCQCLESYSFGRKTKKYAFSFKPEEMRGLCTASWITELRRVMISSSMNAEQ